MFAARDFNRDRRSNSIFERPNFLFKDEWSKREKKLFFLARIIEGKAIEKSEAVETKKNRSGEKDGFNMAI